MNNAQIAGLVRQIAMLARQVSRNTEAIELLSRKFYGVTDNNGRTRTTTNAERISMAVEKYYDLIRNGVKECFAVTEACRAIEKHHGLGDYKNFSTFRNMVNRVIARRK